MMRGNPLSRQLSASVLCRKRGGLRQKNIDEIMGSGEWNDWLVKALEGKILED